MLYNRPLIYPLDRLLVHLRLSQQTQIESQYFGTGSDLNALVKKHLFLSVYSMGKCSAQFKYGGQLSLIQKLWRFHVDRNMRVEVQTLCSFITVAFVFSSHHHNFTSDYLIHGGYNLP